MCPYCGYKTDILSAHNMRKETVFRILMFACILFIWTVLSKKFLTSTFLCEPSSKPYNVELDQATQRIDNHEMEEIIGLVNKNARNSSKNVCRDKVDQVNDNCSRFMKRREYLQNQCSKIIGHESGKRCVQNDVANNLKYAENKEMLFCAIEKTGSTFWKRILHIAGGCRNVSNPTHIALGEADTEKGGYRSMKGKNWTNIVEAFSHKISFIFVRDPYTRLFSGWLDKFYSPNAFYWRSNGKQIVKTQRKTDAKCGYDVTFTEFVNHTVHNVLSSPCIDGHF
ncbi:carbohydrate sulfotransferase 9-like [Mercenaria mercenaria]|uniref:carbohydrate sulfotransferase 9-like n=1 Tax=Mercenaria mercenaria TaxID=6596 RepID=UPI00234F1D69|nr:carbohydrate sulfotransferase 9-like [Mercenaria mercenaria]